MVSVSISFGGRLPSSPFLDHGSWFVRVVCAYIVSDSNCLLCPGYGGAGFCQ